MTYAIGVKALCAFTAKRGDLDRRFTPGPSAIQGMAGHAMVASRRGAGYEPEYRLCGDEAGLRISGRADGYSRARNRLDECKTFRGQLAHVPDNQKSLHWAQLKVYGALLCRRDGLQQVTLALVYFDIGNQEETVEEALFDAALLDRFLVDLGASFSGWATREAAHREVRNCALQLLAFPHEDFHVGQRQLAEAVYATACRGGSLLVQAPTGIGKTIGTLFPLLKAMALGRIDKIFYLAARSTGRALAVEAAVRLKRTQPASTLRIVDLVAREKTCVHPGRACHGDSCPLARGFYDKLPAARDAALECEVMDAPSLREVALRHELCPYYLSQEMLRWSDVIVADYNHYFDSSAMLHGLMREGEWRVGVLVDEAHNLVERARQMYSGTLDDALIDAAQALAPEVLQRPLHRLRGSWDVLFLKQQPAYQAHDTLPQAMFATLREVAAELTEWLAAQLEPAAAPVQRLYFALLQLCRLADDFGAHSLFDCRVDERTGQQSISIRNIVPAPFLRGRFDAAHCIALFSATLSPRRYHEDLLGLVGAARWLDVESPFQPEQLDVHIVGHVSTRYRHRQQSLQPVADLVVREFARAPGNYLLFASSFDYLEQLQAMLVASCPTLPLWPQTRRMSETAASAFLARFEEGGAGLGLVVLGGSFAEGIDLPGSRLSGAFIVTLGLPQVNAVNDEMMKRLQQLLAAGYEYTYLYPGLQRVVQAAGRVIRTTRDCGTLFLIDDRYTLPAVQAVLPRWWRLAGRSLAGPVGAVAVLPTS